MYFTLVYDTFTLAQNKKLEKLNKRATQLVCNDYDSPYNQLLAKTCKKKALYSCTVALINLLVRVCWQKCTPKKNRDKKKLDGKL